MRVIPAHLAVPQTPTNPNDDYQAYWRIFDRLRQRLVGVEGHIENAIGILKDHDRTDWWKSEGEQYWQEKLGSHRQEAHDLMSEISLILGVLSRTVADSRIPPRAGAL